MRSDLTTMNTEQARFNMIEQQIRPWEVLDAQVLRLLSVIKREQFVPAAQRSLAFVDMELPLSQHSDQVMLAPRVQARMLQDLAVQSGDRVLEVGTGSGFMAALLGASAREVVSLEIDAVLAQRAQHALLDAGIGNVQVRVADASQDFLAQGITDVSGEFDVICINGSVAKMPSALQAMLAPGGRMIAVVGDLPVMRAVRLTRVAGAPGVNSDAMRSEPLWDTVAPRMRGFAQPSSFHF